MFDFTHFEELTLASHQPDRIMTIVRSQDDIGIYLRTHLLIEQILKLGLSVPLATGISSAVLAKISTWILPLKLSLR